MTTEQDEFIHSCIRRGHEPRSQPEWCQWCRADIEGGQTHRNLNHRGAADPNCAICRDPKPWQPPECVHLGEALNREQQIEAGCKPCIGGQDTGPKIRECRIHGKCFADVERHGYRSCLSCGFHETEAEDGMVRFQQGASGLGDAILGLTVCKGMQSSTGKKISYAVSPDWLEWIGLFDGYDHLRRHLYNGFPERHPEGGRLEMNLNWDEPKDSIPRWQRYANSVGVARNVLPELRYRENLVQAGERWRNVLALVPFCAHKDREWRIESWKTLEDLAIRSGHRVVIVGNDRERCNSFRSEKLIGAGARDVAALLLNASVVVGNESGIAHFAGAMRCPTIVLCGQMQGKLIHGFYPNSRVIQGKLYCDGCMWKWPKQDHCNSTCASLQTILPSEVLEVIEQYTGKIYTSETSRARDLLGKWCTGYGLDLGFGGDPITPEAIRMDMPTPYAKTGDAVVQLGGDATKLYWFADNTLDYVYSSHLLEDFVDTLPVVREWYRVLKPGGVLVLWLPDEQVYAEHCRKTGQGHNDAHKHADFGAAFMRRIVGQIEGAEIVHETGLVGYSFGMVVRKT